MQKSTATRTEKDSLGDVQIPKDSYYGTTTARAQHNFQISPLKAPEIFKKSLGLVKQAAAQTNHQLGLLEKSLADAINTACEEFIDGKFDSDFTLDVFQAGAGTSYNMNANEIISNRANELLGGKKGEYKFVNPNNHVNIAQSTNDVIPTVTRIAALLLLPDLLKQIAALENAIDKIAKKHKNLIKVGRTHLQDAVPISFGQEFDSYKEAIKKSREFIERQSEDLQVLGIGGTAVGSGINAHPKFKDLMVKNLSKLTGIQLSSAENLTETTNNMNTFMNFSATLRSLATNLMNFCLDLKLMNMGPKAGLSEITLPAVQPGSSIMPGKVNPSIPECVEMICMQVLGNDKTVEVACGKSNFEINVFCPIIMYALLQSMEILTNGLRTLREFSIETLEINVDQIEKLFENSLCTATALAPYLGYAITADIVKTALKTGATVKSEVLKRKLMNEKKLDGILAVLI